jgi:hypothetical protein
MEDTDPVPMHGPLVPLLRSKSLLRAVITWCELCSRLTPGMEPAVLEHLCRHGGLLVVAVHDVVAPQHDLQDDEMALRKRTGKVDEARSTTRLQRSSRLCHNQMRGTQTSLRRSYSGKSGVRVAQHDRPGTLPDRWLCELGIV